MIFLPTVHDYHMINIIAIWQMGESEKLAQHKENTGLQISLRPKNRLHYSAFQSEI